MKAGVFGGTFDPIHLGHLILAHCAAEHLKLDRVVFIPAGDPWRKATREVTPAEHRLEMVRLAVGGDPRFEIDDRELRRAGPSYTVDTLMELGRHLGPEGMLYLLLGEDALGDMPYWRDPERILALARLAVAPRLQTPVPSPPRERPGVALELGDTVRIDMPYIGISSTDLRARAARGESLRYLVPDPVDTYIRKHRLYT